MKFRLIQSVLAVAMVVVASLASAGTPAEKAVVDKLTAALTLPESGLEVGTVSTSEIPGLYEVQFVNGPLVYANASGGFFIVGDMYGVSDGAYVNLAEQRRDGQRLQQLAAVNEEDMIVFAAEGEAKAHITVFTDVTCFYCQKLHKEVPELNKRGVEVRYLAYPRAGVDSDGSRQLASAWCSDNPKETLTRLKNRETVPDKTCDNPIADQYRLGQAMGVRGTPAIVTETGQMIPGYQSADELVVTLGLK